MDHDSRTGLETGPGSGLSARVLDTLPLLISQVGPDLRYRFMNRAYEAWFGQDRRTMLGRSMPEVLGEAAFTRLEPHIRAALAGRTVRFEMTVPYRDGGPREIVAHYIPSDDGGFHAMVEDVTETRRKERRAEQILSGLPDPFIAVDSDIRLTYANPASTRFLPEGAGSLGAELTPLFPPDRIALLHAVLRTGEPVEIEAPSTARPDRVVQMRIFPLDDGLGIHARDVTERRLAERELADREQRLAVAADAVLGVAYDWDLKTDTVVRSSGLKHLLGVSPDEANAAADWWRARVHPDDLARLMAEKTIPHAEAWTEQSYRVQHLDGRWIDVIDRAKVLYDEAGDPVRVIGTTLDVTVMKQAEARLRILVDEVNHRVKNTLATVQSIATLSARSCRDVDVFVSRFQERLASLSRAHNLLTRRHWTDAGLAEVVETAMAPFADEARRIRIEGAAVRLPPRPALALSMAFHELATNAIKYGALSAPQGAVDIVWTVQDGAICIDWIESAGPRVSTPEGKGFGSRLLTSVARDIDGTIQVDYATEGLRCRIGFTLEAAPV